MKFHILVISFGNKSKHQEKHKNIDFDFKELLWMDLVNRGKDPSNRKPW